MKRTTLILLTLILAGTTSNSELQTESVPKLPNPAEIATISFNYDDEELVKRLNQRHRVNSLYP